MRTAILALCGALIGAPSPAFAEGQWYHESGQGVRSALIELEDSLLDVTCAVSSNIVRDGLGVYIGGQPSGPVRFSVDGGAAIEIEFVSGAFDVDTDAKAALFDQLVSALKAGQSVETIAPDGGTATFPLAGAATALEPC